MQAYVYEYGKLKLKDMPEPQPNAGEVVVDLKVAGLNRRDLYIPNRMGNQEAALILGSDGSGIVSAVGKEVSDVQMGDEVIINPALRWDKNSDAPPEGFDILGMPDHGTIAEKIVIAADQVENKPAFLNWQEAGVLALAGLTGYRALITKGNIQPGQTLFVPGASSGVATFIIQFAKAIGARVIVTSRSEAKRKQAANLGADIVMDTNGDWQRELADETIDLVIDSVGAATFNRSLSVLKKGGRIVIFGATAGDTVDLDLRGFFYGQYQLFGSTMGSREELRDMLQFVEREQIHPIVGAVYPLDQVEKAFTNLEENKQFGKIAIEL